MKLESSPYKLCRTRARGCQEAGASLRLTRTEDPVGLPAGAAFSKPTPSAV